MYLLKPVIISISSLMLILQTCKENVYHHQPAVTHPDTTGNNQITKTVANDGSGSTVKQNPDYHAAFSDPTIFEFPDMTVIMEKTVGWLYPKELTESADTIGYSVDLGEELIGKHMKIKAKHFEHLIAEIKYEKTISVHDAGSHIDLRGYKNAYSDWAKLERIAENVFKIKPTESISAEFPHFHIDSVKEEVKKRGGGGWYAIIEDAASIYDDPFSVGISRYFIRISGFATSGNVVQRIIVFEIPLGC